jgi:L-lactate dehydrogenase complex protein LldG
MDNQNTFLGNIRTALNQPAGVERSTKSFPKVFTSPDISETLSTIKNRSGVELEQLVEIFKTNSNDLNQQTHVVASIAEAAAVVVDLIRTKEPEFHHTKHIIGHDHPDIAALQLWKRFTRESVTVHTTFSSDKETREKTILSFIGITAPNIGVADSATVIQLTEPGCPRSTSLVPSIHIALLRRENMVADLAEAYALLRVEKQLDSFVLISGPSKTADIEAHLVHGAHGPCEVHVIILSEPLPEPVVEEISEEATDEVVGTVEESTTVTEEQLEETKSNM